jgi:hypothetical protein
MFEFPAPPAFAPILIVSDTFDKSYEFEVPIKIEFDMFDIPYPALRPTEIDELLLIAERPD